MQDSICSSCRKPKAAFTCEVCDEPVCKKCLTTLDQDAFSFLAEIPEVLKHHYYCGSCYDQNVAPEMDSYQETMERAKDVFIFFKTQKKQIPLIKISKESYQIKSCPDRDETILRMAFFAAKAGYNAVIEVEALADKIRNGSYQTSDWHGTGTAAQIDEEKLMRQDEQNKRYT